MRYRFFVFAGIFPYLYGAAFAYYAHQVFLPIYFILGFIGIVFALIGVEAFNEYFDSEMGGDFIFSKAPKKKVPRYILGIGLFAFFLAFLVALCLTISRGLPILLVSLAGFFCAYFYVGPPLRLAYRGLGEMTIFFAYGPLMVAGGYYLQAKEIGIAPILASSMPGLLVLALAIVNEIPDYFQDRLIGKRNLVVRQGREKALWLYKGIICSFFLLSIAGVAFRRLPIATAWALISLPWVFKNFALAKRTFDTPEKFVSVVRATIALYLFSIFIFIASFLIFNKGAS